MICSFTDYYEISNCQLYTSYSTVNLVIQSFNIDIVVLQSVTIRQTYGKNPDNDQVFKL